MSDGEVTVLDVRPPEEYEKGHLPWSVLRDGGGSCPLLRVPRVGLVDADNLIVPLGIDQNDRSRIFRFWKTINEIHFHAQNVAAAFVPWNRLALADVPEEVGLV